MQTLIYILIMIITLLAQGHTQRIGSPDLILAFIVALSVKRSETETISFAFASGFIQDALFSFGFVNTLAKTISTVVLLFVKKFLVLEKPVLCIVLSAIFCPISVVIGIIISSYFYGIEGSVWSGAQLGSLIITTAATTILSPLFYIMLERISPDEQ